MTASPLAIITVPHPVLKQKAAEVARVDDAVRAQMDAMLATMRAAAGIGLAANQVGLLNRVLVMDLGEEGPGPIRMANPRVLWASEERSAMDEGCLSIPGQQALVERPARVRVAYLDHDGRAAELEASGLLSHCVQHEMDHLDGILCIDYLSRLKRDIIVRKVQRATREAARL
ncbi:MAG: peptide deformylase [Alphaproteobacteria bacterium]|jgi:peptide deformylase|nr:peptide deformylase [Alphaproteobacteria bacterium]